MKSLTGSFNEILNEPNREEVYEDVRKFLEKNIKKVTIS